MPLRFVQPLRIGVETICVRCLRPRQVGEIKEGEPVLPTECVNGDDFSAQVFAVKVILAQVTSRSKLWPTYPDALDPLVKLFDVSKQLFRVWKGSIVSGGRVMAFHPLRAL